jgi:5-methylcytosine-specific restriction endonuclease McrA
MSPQGRNSYARALGWDFDGLRYGIDEVKRIRDSRATTQFLRQQERNKMSTAQRARIINRDNSTCQMCGSKVSDGVTLHVDHIVPVSRGGLTLDDNLRTLCQECNLGKSNRF